MAVLGFVDSYRDPVHGLLIFQSAIEGRDKLAESSFLSPHLL